MAMRMFLIYVLVELAVVIGLVSAIGFGWTVLAIMVTFVVGLALAGSQVTRHLARLQSALNSRSASGALATDSALVALGAVLVVIPGLASTLLGALLLLPPTRRIARPIAVGIVGRRLAATPVVAVYPGGFGRAQRPAPEYVEGEVIDVVDVDGSSSTRPDPTALEYRVIRND